MRAALRVRGLAAFAREHAHGILLVDGARELFTRRQLQASGIDWYGRMGTRRLPPGRYRLQVAAQDLAGNVSAPSRSFFVRIRFVELARQTIRAKAGTRFGVRVSADAKRFRWRLGARSGTARPGLMILRAPAAPGRFRLVVSVRGHQSAATVIVR